MPALLDTLATLAAALHHCNHHAVVYAAFGLTLLLRGALAARHAPCEAREDVTHGLVLLALAVP